MPGKVEVVATLTGCVLTNVARTSVREPPYPLGELLSPGLEGGVPVVVWEGGGFGSVGGCAA